MTSNWVWRHDGTLQCGFGVEETLDEARAALAAIIGDENILNGEKRTLPGPIFQLCGAPTRQVNAFELTDPGFWLLFHGFVGPIGFRPWIDADVERLLAGSEGSYAARLLAGSEGNYAVKAPEGKAVGFPGHGGKPATIEDLYGRICRVYNVGDALTKDYIEHRVNIGLVRGRVAEIWFG
jgi:hypothetical protein